MIIRNGFDPDIPLVTEDRSLLYMEDDRKRTAPTPRVPPPAGEPQWEEEVEIIPASIETRQYGTIPRAVQDEETAGEFYNPGVVYSSGKRQVAFGGESPKRQDVDKKDNSMMMMLGAVVVVGGILLFNK